MHSSRAQGLATVLALLLANATTPQATALTLSVNFVDVFGVDDLAASDTAGAPGADTHVANWNNVQAAASGAASGFVFSDGSPTTAAITYATDLGRWRLPHTVTASSPGDDLMWKGYLDAASTASITLTGLQFVGLYDVHLYYDGDNQGYWQRAAYTVGTTTVDGEDTENTDWGTGNNTAKLFQVPVPGGPGNVPFGTSVGNNDEGNYLIISGLSGSSFTLDIASLGNSGIARARVNGLQVITHVPEPSRALLAAAAMATIVLRRHRRRS